MKELTFRTHGFASLPSGTYLFFPVQAPDEDRRAALAAMNAPAHPQRVVLVTNPEAKSAPTFSGIACGSTLYISLAPDDFNNVLGEMRKPERNFFEKPTTFKYELDQEESVVALSINGHVLKQTNESYAGELTRAG